LVKTFKTQPDFMWKKFYGEIFKNFWFKRHLGKMLVFSAFPYFSMEKCSIELTMSVRVFVRMLSPTFHPLHHN
jgi:hypothetical protein